MKRETDREHTNDNTDPDSSHLTLMIASGMRSKLKREACLYREQSIFALIVSPFSLGFVISRYFGLLDNPAIFKDAVCQLDKVRICS